MRASLARTHSNLYGKHQNDRELRSSFREPGRLSAAPCSFFHFFANFFVFLAFGAVTYMNGAVSAALKTLFSN